MSAGRQSAQGVEQSGASRAENAFVVFVLLFSAGAFSSLWTVPEQTESASGMLVMQVLWTLIYIVTLSLFFRHQAQPFRTIFSEWPFLALCAFAMLSLLWSQLPGLTFRRSVALTLTVLFGTYFGSRFGLREQLRLLAWAFAICIFFSLLFGAFGLGRSVDFGKGVPGWYGIFDQKNVLGRMMVLSALVFLFWRRVEPDHNRLANAGLLGSVALVALSRSTTAVLVLIMLLVLLPYVRWTARKNARWMVAGMLGLAAAATTSMYYLAAHFQNVTDLLGKDATLTGRIQIWIVSTAMALRRPWLGYGFDSFWLQTQGPTVRIWHVLGWAAPNAHNGFLDLWLQLGALGLGLFLLVFFYYLLRSIRFLRERQGAGMSAWPFLFLAFEALMNLTQTDFLSTNTIFSFLFIAAAIATQTGPKESRVLDEAEAPQPSLA